MKSRKRTCFVCISSKIIQKEVKHLLIKSPGAVCCSIWHVVPISFWLVAMHKFLVESNTAVRIYGAVPPPQHFFCNFVAQNGTFYMVHGTCV